MFCHLRVNKSDVVKPVIPGRSRRGVENESGGLGWRRGGEGGDSK